MLGRKRDDVELWADSISADLKLISDIPVGFVFLLLLASWCIYSNDLFLSICKDIYFIIIIILDQKKTNA